MTVRARMWMGACLLHAVLFLGLYQVGYTPDEWSHLGERAQREQLSTTALLLREGPWALARAYYRTDSDERLYREYAELTLTGHADFAYIAGKQYDADRSRPQGYAVPYRDVRVEYPPLALFLGMVPPRLVSGPSYAGYRMALGAWLCLLHCANLAAALWLMRARGAQIRDERRLLAASLLFCLLLGNIVATRIDHLVTLSLLCGVICIERSLREAWSRAAWWALGLGAIAAAGAATKIVPGLLLPAGCIVWLGSARPDRIRLSATACASGALLGVVIHGLSWLSFGDGYFETFTYHAARGIQLESTYSSVLLLAGWAGLPLSLELSFGSSNVVSAADAWLKWLVPSLAVGAFSWLMWAALRERARDALLLTTLLTLLFVLTNKVFSPQYLIWLALPLLSLHQPEARPRITFLLLVGAALSQVLYPRAYAALKQFSPALAAVLALRNLCIIGLMIRLVSLLRATSSRAAPLPCRCHRARGRARGRC